MKIPWFNRKKKQQGEEKTQQVVSKDSRPLFKFNGKTYSEESLSTETQDLIKKINNPY